MNNYIPQDIQNMQDVLPPDYQDFLDKQEPDISDRDKATEVLIAESLEMDK